MPTNNNLASVLPYGTAQWLSNKASVMSVAAGVYGVNPNNLPSETLPSDVSTYGVLLIFNSSYRYIRYIDVFGEECVFATHTKQWVKKNSLSEADLTAKYNEGYSAGQKAGQSSIVTREVSASASDNSSYNVVATTSVPSVSGYKAAYVYMTETKYTSNEGVSSGNGQFHVGFLNNNTTVQFGYNWSGGNGVTRPYRFTIDCKAMVIYVPS